MAYSNTFITVAADCPIQSAEIPLQNRAKKTAHLIQYELLTEQPYHFDHKSLIFQVHLLHKGLIDDLSKMEKESLWETMFSKGHPCLRASALTKRYAFGAHYDENGKIAIYPLGTAAYQAFLDDDGVKKIPAMKSKRK